MKAAAQWLALRNRGSPRWGALLCLALFLTLQCFATSGALHRVLHSDSAAPSHHCVITLLSQGQVTADFVPVLILFAGALIFCLPRLHAIPLCASDCRLSPSRAPPRS